MKVVALIQCVADDIGESQDASDYAVEACRSAMRGGGVFDSVALACPDTLSSGRLEELAKKWGVACYRGDEFNVASRLLAAALAEQADIVVRILLRQFYLDIEQVGRMIFALRSAHSGKGHYVTLPSNYNYSLAGDVCTMDALARAVDEIDGLPDSLDKASFQFSPWVYMERKPESFPPVFVDGGPSYPPERTIAIRERYRLLSSENQTHFAWNFPASSYRFIGRYLNSDWRVLDIACGKGEGVKCLREFCDEVVGVDMDSNYISCASTQSTHMSGMSYLVGDAETFMQPSTYDAIISLHTLEHLKRPKDFFKCSEINLRDNGYLFLEVPLLLPHPLGSPLLPWHEKEYLLSELVSEVKAAGFAIEEVWVKQRHAFVNIKTGDVSDLPPKSTAGLVVARKTSVSPT